MTLHDFLHSMQQLQFVVKEEVMHILRKYDTSYNLLKSLYQALRKKEDKIQKSIYLFDSLENLV